MRVNSRHLERQLWKLLNQNGLRRPEKVYDYYLFDLSCHRWSCHTTDGPPGPSAAEYVAVDGPPGPSMAAIDGPPGPSVAP